MSNLLSVCDIKDEVLDILELAKNQYIPELK